MATAAPAPISIHPGVRSFLDRGLKKLLIGGQWVEAASGKTFDTINPATGDALAKVAEGGPEDIERSVAAARQALEEGPWGRMSPSDKSRLLWKTADLIEAHGEELAQLDTLDNGKTIRESLKGDLPLAVDLFRYYAGWATKIHGETIPVSTPYFNNAKFFTCTVREPVGVIGIIIPWNFPLLMMAERVAPALACGNTVVVKPAEQTPLSALRLAELMMEAGFPAGVLNIVNGGPAAGAALANHRGVDKISFTGSTEVGREIVKASAGNLKRLSLELGGKSPNIIFADADFEAAARGAFMGIFYNQGQCCSAGSRVFVEKSKFDEVLEFLTKKAKTIRQGPGMDPNTQMGPLVSEEQRNRVLSYVQSGRQEGARLLAGGEKSGGELTKGYFVQPTVFADVKDDMKICREEIFGPVVAVTPFETFEEVVARANKTDYGLVAGVWTRDVKKAFRLAQAVKAGTVWVNCFQFVDAASPWGGYKQSGYGREKGQYAIEEYTQLKSIWVDLN